MPEPAHLSQPRAVAFPERGDGRLVAGRVATEEILGVARILANRDPPTDRYAGRPEDRRFSLALDSSHPQQTGRLLFRGSILTTSAGPSSCSSERALWQTNSLNFSTRLRTVWIRLHHKRICSVYSCPRPERYDRANPMSSYRGRLGRGTMDRNVLDEAVAVSLQVFRAAR